MANHDNYVIQGSSLDAIANEVKILSDTSDQMTVDEITSNIAQVNSDVNSQADIIAQIQTALEGKAAGSGSEIIAEIVSLIDQSGVLDSTDGTATEKVEWLIDKAEWEKFWYEQSETWTSQLSSLFVGAEKIPRLNFENCTVFRGCLKGNNAERIDYYINCGKATDINRALQDCKKLKFLYGIDGSSAKIWSATFSGCILLETIQEPLNFQSATSTDSVFQNCNALKNICFVEESIKVSISFANSPLLSDESIQSIIDGLADLTGSTAQTLTLNATVKAKLTETQLATITNKNWNLA